jgi:Xaa-Pro aminopeptidase
MNLDRRGDRLAALRPRVAAAALEALLVVHPANVRYLTGFSGSAGLLVVAPHRAVLVTDPRYRLQAAAEIAGVADLEIEASNLWNRLGSVLAGMDVQSLGFERERMTVHAVERLRGAADVRLEPVGGLVEALRVSKDPGEVAAVRQAGALALEALAEVLPTVRVGETELDVAARLETALRVRGSEWHPFPTIVASGPRSALPHAATSRRALETGDLLLLDFGAQVDGYCADLTRTLVVGRVPDSRQREVYDAVRGAQTVALNGIRAGMAGQEADALARQHLDSRGLGPAFSHSLGHGLGLEVHEDPRLSRTATDPLPPNAVVTVEPGVYLEGWGGVRLEDDLLLAAEGPVRLTPGAPGLESVP